MGIFFAYILKSAICLSCFYLFYRWLLSKETFHRFNRIALLSILLFSLLIPFLEVTVKQHTELNRTVLTVEQLLMMTDFLSTVPVESGVVAEIPSLSWIQIGLLIYLAGVVFFTCRNLYSLFRMCLLLKSGKYEKMDGKIFLLVHERDLAPFSWMRYIVISRKDLEENGREILIHETAHIRNRHSIDLLVADICIFFQWFNPGAWLLKQELQNIHEYEADETVIKEGVNAKEYQLLLIKKAVGTRLYSIANNFNHSKLKKRITMILKEKSNPWARVKYLYVLPLAAVAVAAFARPEVSKTTEEISAVKVNELATIVETTLKENVEVPVDTTKKIVVRGERIAAGDSTMRVIGYKSKDRYIESGKEEPLIIINDKESDIRVLNAIDPAFIQDITVLKSPRGVEIYGEKGKNGVMLVQLLPKSKTIEVNPNLTENVKVRVSTLLGERNSKDLGLGIKVGSVNELTPEKQPLVFIDGKQALGDEPLSRLSPDRIKSISVVKEKSALEAYGDKGKNGVIEVTLLTEEEYQAKNNKSEILLSDKTY